MYKEITHIAQRIEHGSLSGDKAILDELEKVLYDDIGGMEITDTMQAWVLGTVLAVTLLFGIVVGALIW
jgi:hypothetical protein